MKERHLYKFSPPGYNAGMKIGKRQAGFRECRQRQHDPVVYQNRFSGL
jgi:hypothetical protein